MISYVCCHYRRRVLLFTGALLGDFSRNNILRPGCTGIAAQFNLLLLYIFYYIGLFAGQSHDDDQNDQHAPSGPMTSSNVTDDIVVDKPIVVICFALLQRSIYSKWLCMSLLQ